MEENRPQKKSVRSYLQSILHSSNENVMPNRCQLQVIDAQSTSSKQGLHATEKHENVYSAENRTPEDKRNSEPVRSYLFSISNATEENATSNHSALTPVNEQVTQTSSSNPVNDQDASNDEEEKTKENGNGLSICGTLCHELSSKNSMQLIDLIPDCLDYILNDLSFADLISVAGTCTFLQNIASEFFITHAKNHEVIIDCDDYPRYKVNMQSKRWPSAFNGRDFEAFIFGFKSVVEKLTIKHLFPLRADEMRQRNDAKVESIIVKAFAGKEKLSELKFYRCGWGMLKEQTLKLKSEFHVESVTFEQCILRDTAFNWPNLFPNMKKLAIIDCDVSMAGQCIEKTFPHLTCFDLTVSYLNENTWFDCTFTEQNVERFIDENPNIQKLALRYWNETAYDAKLLKYAAEHLASLESLHLWHLQYTEFYSEDAINFPYVRKLTLTNDFYHPEKLKQNLGSLTFHALEKFYILGKYDAECVTFLARHQNIRKFICYPHGQHSHYPTDSDLKKFCVLKQLKCLCISGDRLTPSSLIQFISDCATVSLIKIRNLAFSSELRESFGKNCKARGWKVTYVDNVPKIIMKKI